MAASLMEQRGVAVSSAAASLVPDQAIFPRTYAYEYTGDLRAVADAMDRVRADAIGEDGTQRTRPIGLVDGREIAGTNRGAEVGTQKRAFSSEKMVEAMGLEPTNLLTASQALYQLSYAPSGGRST
jgi:hypothetical protein